ncbi:MAG: MliC family protein [Pseudomonadota bacterium]
MTCARPAALALAAILTLSVPDAEAAERTSPAFDCGRSIGKVEELICRDPGLAALDRRLTARFAAAVKSLRSAPDAKAAVKAVRSEQRGWISGRNECWKADNMRACAENAYLAREGALVATYLLDTPVSEAAFVCNANPADAFDAAFFGTALPSVRVERGDTVMAGTLVPTASGARYALPFGRSLWLKGDEAVLVWPEGQEHVCRRAPGSG